MKTIYDRVEIAGKLSTAIRNKKYNVESVLYANALIYTIMFPVLEPEIRITPSGEIEFFWIIDNKMGAEITVTSKGVVHYRGSFPGDCLMMGTEPKIGCISDRYLVTVDHFLSRMQRAVEEIKEGK